MKKTALFLIALLTLSATDTSAKVLRLHQMSPLSAGGTNISLPSGSNGGDVSLSRIDYLYSIGDGPFIQNGSMAITYDENGSIIRTESVQNNTDDIINIFSSLRTTLPLNASLYNLTVKTDDENRKEVYYIDPETGLRHDISISITTNYNGEPVYVIEKELDNAGNMIEYAKVESEFDDQGRPVTTIFYTPHLSENDSTYLDLYRKLEYEYLPDGLASRTRSQYIISPDGNNYWQPAERIIQGTDPDGYYCYERLSFNPSGSAWIGQEKYRKLAKNDECTTINWEWNDNSGKWIPYDKSTEKFNEYGCSIYQDKYSYDTTLCAFYLDYKEGSDYIGDSLQAEWGIYYDEPQSLEQLSDPESLISWSFKYSDIYYTEQELGISLSDYPGLELPEKGYVSYSLESHENGVYNWVPSEMAEHEYALLPRSYDNPVPTFKKTLDRTYTYDKSNDEWYLSEEEKSQYDEHGSLILMERYENGSIYERSKNQYIYITLDDGVVVQLPVLTTTSQIYNGIYMPVDSTYYEYDNENKLLYSYYFSEWKQADSIWEEQIRHKITYENNIVTEVYSEWYFEEGIWFDYKKYTTEFYPSGDLKNILTYYLTLDDRDSLFWMKYDSVNIVKDDAGRIILYESYFYLDPNTNLWLSGIKEEITYDDTAFTQTSVKSIMDQETNEWYPESKNIEQKNLLGEVILSESYQWDEDLSCWIGTEKNEEEHDINGNLIHSATYEWNPDSLRWTGLTRSDSQFDDSGELIWECCYDSTDASGNWIPLAKTLNYYDESGIFHIEYYMWDYDRNDWWGMNKSENYDSDTIYMEAEYIWDDEAWCWEGISKEEYIFSQYNIIQLNYAWDKASKNWINDIMIETTPGPEDKKSSIISTQSKWDSQESEWIPDFRETLFQPRNDKGNVEYFLIVNEKYDLDRKEWYHNYSTKDLYVYDNETAVESVSVDADITISEGVIYVNAADESRITIVSVAGGVVASGTHSVSASVVPGIYLINVDGKTAKVIVR